MKETIKKVLKIISPIVVIILITLGVMGYRYWQKQLRYPTSLAANITAHIVPVMTPTKGRLAIIYVNPQSIVKRGDLLAKLDQTVYQEALEQASANLVAIQQQVSNGQKAVITAEQLVNQRQTELSALSKKAFNLDQMAKDQIVSADEVKEAHNQVVMATIDLESAQQQLKEAYSLIGNRGYADAKLSAAQAALKQAQLNLALTEIVAPTAGAVNNFHLQVGQPVNANQILFNLIEDNDWGVIARFQLSALSRIKPQQIAVIKLSYYPEHYFSGIVTGIQNGVVKIKILNPDINYPLEPDSNATVIIDTQNETTQALNRIRNTY